MTSYVVVSKNEDRVRVFGTFRDRAKADALAAVVNVEIEAEEDLGFADWQVRNQTGEIMPDGYGRCGVLIVHKWSHDRAVRFALGELDS